LYILKRHFKKVNPAALKQPRNIKKITESTYDIIIPPLCEDEIGDEVESPINSSPFIF